MKTSIPQRLAIFVAGFLVVTLGVCGVFFLQTRRNAQAVSALTTTSLAHLSHGTHLLEELGQVQNIVQRILRLKDPDDIEKQLAVLAVETKQNDTNIAAVVQQGSGIQAKYAELMQANKVALDQLLLGDYAAAQEALLGKVNPKFEALQAEIQQHTKAIEAQTVRDLDVHLKAQQQALLWSIGGVVCVLGLLGLAGWQLQRRLTRQLGEVAESLGQTSEQLSANSSLVASASQRLAEHSSEQAASLEETSAVIEQITSTARQSLDNARSAKESAALARQAAETGAADMQELSAATTEMKAASDNISHIIKTIDEIAFMTNLLALNAAVEAARAGEAGLGFAVVADEVRNLAQRSARAARETTEKIETAMAKNERTMQISSRVATSLQEIATKARQVDEHLAGIVSASQQQTEGTAQVNTAVTQMDKVTQNNAAGAEESASASEELNAQAEALKDMVGQLLELVGRQAGKGDTTVRASEAPKASAAVAPSPKADPLPLPQNGNGNGHGHYAESTGHRTFAVKN